MRPLIPPPPGRVVTVETRNGTRITGKVGSTRGATWQVAGASIRPAAVTRWTLVPVERVA